MTETKSSEYKGLPKTEYIERFDGSRWRKFDLNRGGVLILTTRGQQLLSFNPQLRHSVLDYRNDARANIEGYIRKWFKAGGNSDVYSFNGHPILVKEASTAHSLWSALDRMDYLYGICEKFLPPHIKVPDMYGILYAPDLKKQYLLMQKVNEGLTVADLIKNGYPEMDNDLKSKVIEEFQGLEDRVRQAIEVAPGRQYMPKNLLPDWDAGNVVVDFSTPTKEIPFTFWIIDQ